LRREPGAEGATAMKISIYQFLTVALSTSLVSGAGVWAADEKPVPEAKAPAAARLTIEKEVMDVGDVVRGKMATAVFELRNTGPDVLKILEAKPG